VDVPPRPAIADARSLGLRVLTYGNSAFAEPVSRQQILDALTAPPRVASSADRLRSTDVPSVAPMPQWRQNYPNNRPPTPANAISEMGRDPMQARQAG
jgi:hypothetical protein